MIENLKDLEKFFKLCRKQGVVEANLVNHTYKFGDLPHVDEDGIPVAVEEISDPYDNFPQGNLTPEQLVHYASGGTVEDDPYRGEQ
jgi:hypothetical protein